LRPTITEQLRQTRRILEEEIAPCLVEKHPVQVLAYLLGNLQSLEDSWSRVLPFLHWDNSCTAALLQSVSSEVEPALAAQIADTVRAAAPDVLDFEAVQKRNADLRGLLARCVRESGAGELVSVRTHLLERSKRFPFRPAPRSLAAKK
jgi:hypothetical protein